MISSKATLISVTLLPLLMATAVHGAHVEHQLYDKLMGSYDALERPVANSSHAVEVKLSVILQQLIDVDEKNQIVTVNAWLKYTWNDYKLVWSPADYSGITDVRFPVGTLWKPDVLLYNSVDSSFDSTYGSNMIAYSDGTISWIPPGIFKISCKIDITWFPFDEQACFFKFGSWTYDGTKLNLQPDESGMDMSEYLINGEWNLYKTVVTRNEKFYDCCPEPYPDLRFIMLMKRRTLYFGFNLIIPCILITLMTILGFTLPPDSGEKIGLQITVLLSICFFLSIVSDMTPPTSEAVPLLGTFFSTCMFVVSASVVLTVAVLNFHHRTPDTHEMGALTSAVLLYWVPWLLMMQRPGKNITRKDLPPLWPLISSSLPFCGSSGDKFNVSQCVGDGDDEESQLIEDDEGAGELEKRIKQCFKLLADNGDCMSPGQQAILMMMHRIFVELKFITNRMADEDEAGDKQNDWKFAAMAIDRMCLVLFSVFIAGSTCYIFFTAPYLTT